MVDESLHASPFPLRELDAFLEQLADGLGRPARGACLRDYGFRLLAGMGITPPLDAPNDPLRESARHQAQHHFIAKADWPDDEVRRRARAWVLEPLELVPDTVWLVEDVEIAKRGRHSVGVARQYGVTPGRHGNCQIASAVTLARRADSLPLACDLILPGEWARDPDRCRRAGVPIERAAMSRTDIALAQLGELLAHGFPRRRVFADIRHGQDPAFRQGLDALGLDYLVSVPASTPLRSSPGALSTAGELARSLSPDAFRAVATDDGSADFGLERFAARRVTPDDTVGGFDRPREAWLVFEHRPVTGPGLGYALCNLPPEATLQDIVRLVRHRRSLELHRFTTLHKLQLAHYAGRGWRGFHHHATLALAMLAFVTAPRWAAVYAAKAPNGRERPTATRAPSNGTDLLAQPIGAGTS